MTLLPESICIQAKENKTITLDDRVGCIKDRSHRYHDKRMTFNPPLNSGAVVSYYLIVNRRTLKLVSDKIRTQGQYIEAHHLS